MHNVLYYNIISIIYIAFMYIYVYIYRKFIFTYNTYLITALKLCYFQWNLIIWNNLKHRKIYHINWVIKCVRLYRLWAFQYAPSLRSNQSLNLWMYIDGFEFCFCFFSFDVCWRIWTPGNFASFFTHCTNVSETSNAPIAFDQTTPWTSKLLYEIPQRVEGPDPKKDHMIRTMCFIFLGFRLCHRSSFIIHMSRHPQFCLCLNLWLLKLILYSQKSFLLSLL